MRARWLIGATAWVASALVLSGCAAFPLGCREAGLVNYLSVYVDGPGADLVDDIDLCADGKCAIYAEEAQPRESNWFWVTHNVDHHWSYSLGPYTPDRVALSVVDGSAAVLLETEQSIEWKNVQEPNGPGCGERADPVTITVIVP